MKQINASLPRMGMIGLGIMGTAMAKHLLAAGYHVIGYDVDAKARARLKKSGGLPQSTIESVVQRADIVITSLPSAGAFHDVSQHIILAAAKHTLPLKILIETSTLPLADKVAGAKRLKSVGIAALDCPIIGTIEQLPARTWTLFASGPKKIYQQALPVLQTFTDATPYMGSFGAGSKMKFVANHLVAIYNVAYAESVTLARKMGLNPSDVLKHFGHSPILGNGVMRSRMAMMVARQYSPATMKVAVWQKDMAIIGDMAKSVDCPTPLFTATADIYTAAMAQGLALEDTASTAEVLGLSAGLKPRRQAEGQGL
jgi:3-hydroxyisobutyrate dehydrogenase-like beta-hydroxyacid dehydrogenase